MWLLASKVVPPPSTSGHHGLRASAADAPDAETFLPEPNHLCLSSILLCFPPLAAPQAWPRRLCLFPQPASFRDCSSPIHTHCWIAYAVRHGPAQPALVSPRMGISFKRPCFRFPSSWRPLHERRWPNRAQQGSRRLAIRPRRPPRLCGGARLTCVLPPLCRSRKSITRS